MRVLLRAAGMGGMVKEKVYPVAIFPSERLPYLRRLPLNDRRESPTI